MPAPTEKIYFKLVTPDMGYVLFEDQLHTYELIGSSTSCRVNAFIDSEEVQLTESMKIIWNRVSYKLGSNFARTRFTSCRWEVPPGKQEYCLYTKSPNGKEERNAFDSLEKAHRFWRDNPVARYSFEIAGKVVTYP